MTLTYTQVVIISLGFLLQSATTAYFSHELAKLRVGYRVLKGDFDSLKSNLGEVVITIKEQTNEHV